MGGCFPQQLPLPLGRVGGGGAGWWLTGKDVFFGKQTGGRGWCV